MRGHGYLSALEVTCTTGSSFSDFFDPSGLLAGRLEGYEYRPQQLEFARAVDDFLRDPEQSTMAAEAPPGVGKTFAVLIPAILAAKDSHILFLTASIALQEQLIAKDLPKLNALLGKKFSYGLLKGRSNYICLRRAGGYIPYPDAPVDIARWIEETESGDLAELPLPSGHPALVQTAASARNCLGAGCPFRGRCFVTQAFRNAQDWQVVVANYHLFFSHILSGKGSFPVKYHWLVCDEAHRIPEAARNAVMVEADAENGASLLRPRTLSGFDALFAGHQVDGSLFKKRAAVCRDALDALFGLVELQYRPGDGIAECSEEVLHKGKEMTRALDKLLEPLRALEDRFRSGEFENSADLGGVSALMNWIEEVGEFKKAVLWCLSVSDFPAWGYWRGANARGANVLMSAPVVCADIVRDALESEGPEKSVLVSATLSLNGDFSFWSRETGIRPDKTLVVTSPFDFGRQMELLIVDIGIPVASQGYDDRICRAIEKLCDENGGRTLVLLSSLRLLKSLAQWMRKRERTYDVLLQGDLPQKELLKRFREDETSVLIGSVSFREGVDIPGKGLTQVIIDRIPFPHPNDPLIQARNVLEGQKTFVRTTLPNVKMFLRQAVGRLIRSSSDHGRVVLLDGRALDRKEWKILESLPACKCRRLSIKT
ncbi:MAG: ATP-dependent DNA helicase [Synergistaceae bacterium]|nr:ATP-dependent DNA helicase [Synergistaceae bacterium]